MNKGDPENIGNIVLFTVANFGESQMSIWHCTGIICFLAFFNFYSNSIRQIDDRQI